jgi:ribonuclease HI
LTQLTIFVDGASKGNPGHAGIGVRIESNGDLLKEYCGYIGQATNNTAGYRALLKGLEIARELEANRVSVISDSELVVRQMNGEYRVKNASLLPLYQDAQKRSKHFDAFQIRHVPRSKNKDADRLANQGIENQESSKQQADHIHLLSAYRIIYKRAGWPHPLWMRKVRAPQGRMLGNAQAG